MMTYIWSTFRYNSCLSILRHTRTYRRSDTLLAHRMVAMLRLGTWERERERVCVGEYVCVCVCVCVCKRERKREKEKVSLCVCV